MHTYVQKAKRCMAAFEAVRTCPGCRECINSHAQLPLRSTSQAITRCRRLCRWGAHAGVAWPSVERDAGAAASNAGCGVNRCMLEKLRKRCFSAL